MNDFRPHNDIIDVNPSNVTVEEPGQQSEEVDKSAAAMMVAGGIRAILFNPYVIGFIIFLVLAILAGLYFYYVLRPQSEKDEEEESKQPVVEEVKKTGLSINDLVQVQDGVYVVKEKLRSIAPPRIPKDEPKDTPPPPPPTKTVQFEEPDTVEYSAIMEQLDNVQKESLDSIEKTEASE